MDKNESCGRVDERTLSRLKWRCRRGLLENDLFVQRFLQRHEGQLTRGNARALARLMELADNDLLDLLLARTEIDPSLDDEDVRDVLNMMRVRGVDGMGQATFATTRS